MDPVSWGDMEKAYSQIPLGQMYLLGQGELYTSAVDLAKIGMILAGMAVFWTAIRSGFNFCPSKLWSRCTPAGL